MNWTQQIDRCEFLLDYVYITIVSDKPNKLVKQLSQYAQFKKTVLEKYAKHPIMADMFKSRSYFSFGKIVKIYLIHDKIASLQNINALLVLHDVPLLELAQIEKILEAMPAVTDFHFCRIEFRWDLYPKKTLPAVDLQKHIVRHLHLKNAQDAWHDGKDSRITYYIGWQPCHLQSKVYIRPQKPNPGKPEFVRFELTANTDWLQPKKKKGAKRKPRLWLIKPSDFKKFTYGHLTQQVKWLDIDWAKLRTHQYNLLTGGIWRKRFDEYRDEKGIANAIIHYREKKVCLPQCSICGHRKECNLLMAHENRKTRFGIVKAVRNCPLSCPPKFETKYTCESKYSLKIEKILERGYNNWNLCPLFVQTPQKISKVLTRLPIRKKKCFKNTSLKSNYLEKLFG